MNGAGVIYHYDNHYGHDDVAPELMPIEKSIARLIRIELAKQMQDFKTVNELMTPATGV